MHRWLLAAGCLALAGCRTEVGEEESSSWFNFSSRHHGGGHGGSGAKPSMVEPTAPKPDPVSEAWNEPPAAPVKTAAETVPPTDAPKPERPKTEEPSVPRAADHAGEARAGRSTLELPTPPAAPRTDRPTSPTIELALPDAGPTGLRSAPTIPLGVDGRDTPARPAGTLELPTLSGDPRRPTIGGAVGLPALPPGASPRQPTDALRLPGFDDPTADPAHRPGSLGTSIPDGRNRPRAGDRLGFPEISPSLPRSGPDGPMNIDWDGLLQEPRGLAGRDPVAGLSNLPAGTSRPDESRGALELSTGQPALRTGQNPPGVIPGLRPEIAGRAATSGTSPRLAVGPGPVAVGREASTPPRLTPAMDALDPRAPGTPRPLPPVPNAVPPEARIPLPFRLSEWISDEQQHRLWRQQHLERARQEPVERQAEQDRLREALLKWLARDPAAK